MDPTMLSTVIATLIALSVASERLVEIIKGFIPALDQKSDDQKKESRRKAYLHILAVLAGIATAFLSRKALQTYIPKEWDSTVGVLALGLLASGGSSFWNSILGYVNEVKKIKKNNAKDR